MSGNGQPTVLVIDDETGILESLRILLKNEGFSPVDRQRREAGARADRGAAAGHHPERRAHAVGGRRAGPERGASARSRHARHPHDRASDAAVGNAGGQRRARSTTSRSRSATMSCSPFSAARPSIASCASRTGRCGRRSPAGTDIVQSARRERASRWLDIVQLAETVAPTESTILIQGESGTGKEVIARYIHQLSLRTDGPFLSINCGALPESLLESELFGHVKGSFTGAVKDKSGLFTAAAGGTFFLDEIGETTPATQVKLLRVLQHREVIPVGATEAHADRHRLRRGDQSRSRGRDQAGRVPQRPVLSTQRHRAAPATAARTARRHPAPHRFVPAPGVGGSRRAGEAGQHRRRSTCLQGFSWPGNVRELENALERAVILTAGPDHRCQRTAGADHGAARRATRLGAHADRIRRSRRSSARTSSGFSRARAGTRRGRPKCSASTPRRCIGSCRGSGSRRDRVGDACVAPSGPFHDRSSACRGHGRLLRSSAP